MSKQKNQKFKNEIAKTAFPYIVKALHVEGIITDNDLLDKTIVLNKVKEYLDDENNEINFELIVDHRDYIINLARLEEKKGNTELTTTLYATYVEHTLNRIIHIACVSKKHDYKTQNEIIRNINIGGKCTWLLELLELPALNPNHVKTILEISDERNSFIHYKWKPELKLSSISRRRKIEDVERKERIDSLLKYLENYESELEFKGDKEKFDLL